MPVGSVQAFKELSKLIAFSLRSNNHCLSEFEIRKNACVFSAVCVYICIYSYTNLYIYKSKTKKTPGKYLKIKCRQTFCLQPAGSLVPRAGRGHPRLTRPGSLWPRGAALVPSPRWEPTRASLPGCVPRPLPGPRRWPAGPDALHPPEIGGELISRSLWRRFRLCG